METPSPAGTKSYTCHVVRGRGSNAPTFDAGGATEAEALKGCIDKAQAAKARVTQVRVTEWTADGKGFTYSNLMFGGRRISIAEARQIICDAAKPAPLETVA